MVNIEFLSNIPFFSSLSSTQLEDMALHWSLVEKNADEIIFKTGESADTVYIVQKGMVTITLETEHGEPLVLSILNKGEMFGELTLFEIARRTANAVASTKTTLLCMSRHDYIAFLKKYPEIAIKMLAVLSRRLRDTNEMIRQQVTRNVNEEIESKFTLGDRIADKFASFIGSWTFILIFILILISWIMLNTYEVLFRPLDHYPFILLNLILSCLAAVQAPVIMMSQGRQAKKDHLAAELDYKINLKAELQIQEILARLDRMNQEEILIQKEEPKAHHEIIAKLDELLRSSKK